MLRVLRLTNSDDFTPEIPVAERASAVAECMLAAATRQEVDTVAKGVWPAPELPAIIEGWMVRYEPDMVFFRVASYWFTYESVPLRLERLLGRWVRPVTRLGNRAATNKRIGHNRVFKALQKAALRTIGGATLLTPDETVTLVENCLRPILAREGVGVVVRGPRTPFALSNSERAVRRSEAKRQYVNRRLAEVCARHHLTFAPFESVEDARDDSLRLGDLVHITAEAQRSVGEMEGTAMVREFSRRR